MVFRARWMFDQTGRLVDDEVGRLLGFDESRMFSADTFERVHPDDRKLAERRFNLAWQDRLRVSYAIRFLCPDRQYRWAWVSCWPEYAGGHFAGVRGVFTIPSLPAEPWKDHCCAGHGLIEASEKGFDR